MNNKILLICLLSILFFACSSPKKEITKPINLIEKGKLTKIVAEAYVIESIVYNKAQSGADYSTLSTKFYSNLFKRYNINRKQFTESLSFYLEYDEDVANIYKDAISILMAAEAKEK